MTDEAPARVPFADDQPPAREPATDDQPPARVQATDDRPPSRVQATDDRPPVRVLVADDQAMVRGSFRVLVDHTPGMTAVGEAATGAEAVELARRERPDVVLMDIRMPELDGIEATRRICADPDTSRVRVLVLTTFDLDGYVYAALRAGATGFLLKDTPPADVLTAIGVVAAGESLLAPSVTSRLIAEFARRPEPGRPPARSLDGVTDRELEVLGLIARGLSNTEIAQHLHLSQATVKTHIGRLLAKLRARDRAQLVIVAYETGLVDARRRDA
ncbi:response regulator [Streptomyces sp. NPDC048685]|uniref:response regulator n=1 Tax=Streptomyces sp. NPDC048685 TaxID=3365584 RepID=UPI00371CF204